MDAISILVFGGQYKPVCDNHGKVIGIKHKDPVALKWGIDVGSKYLKTAGNENLDWSDVLSRLNYALGKTILGYFDIKKACDDRKLDFESELFKVFEGFVFLTWYSPCHK